MPDHPSSYHTGAMTDARNLAYAHHGDRRTAAGELFVEHLERVAASVPPEARRAAYLHDILEHSDASVADLEAAGVTPVELQAVQLLTRHPDESFEAHALRIASAKGPAGRLARMVKLADIDDHLSQGGGSASHRPYGWARRHVAASCARFDSPPALHGLFDSSEGWTRLCEATGGTRIAFDLPGSGHSDAPPRGSVAGYARDVAQRIDALGVERFTLVGHSLGGAVAAALAELMPERIEALFPVSTRRLRAHPPGRDRFHAWPTKHG
jgi:hypothetical protein